MPLISLWNSNPTAISELSIEQIVTTAGDGILKDGSICSKELFDYFSQISAERLGIYAEQCLLSKFEKSGFALQDLVNEQGRRLDYTVTNGRYQGVPNAIGFDGLWRSPEGNTIIVEVKTTDAYRISLDTLAEYRNRLLHGNVILGSPTILIVVGRQDTGELEAQIRGSRHAWDIRLISIEALIKLVSLKVNSDDSETGIKIRGILLPFEYTRLDRLVDVMFTTASETAPVAFASEIESTSHEEIISIEVPVDGVSDLPGSGSNWEFTDAALLDGKRQSVLNALAKRLGVSLVKKSRALFWSADHINRVACTISKRYIKRPTYPYWYAFHPQWDQFLEEGKDSLLALGCMDLNFAFAVPHSTIREILSDLNTTETEKGKYWHIHISGDESHGYEILVPKRASNLSIGEYKVPL